MLVFDRIWVDATLFTGILGAGFELNWFTGITPLDGLELEFVEARLECSDDIHEVSEVDDVVPECVDVTDELSSELGAHILLHSEFISCCTSSEFLAANLCFVSWYLSGVAF